MTPWPVISGVVAVGEGLAAAVDESLAAVAVVAGVLVGAGPVTARLVRSEPAVEAGPARCDPLVHPAIAAVPIRMVAARTRRICGRTGYIYQTGITDEIGHPALEWIGPPGPSGSS